MDIGKDIGLRTVGIKFVLSFIFRLPSVALSVLGWVYWSGMGTLLVSKIKRSIQPHTMLTFSVFL